MPESRRQPVASRDAAEALGMGFLYHDQGDREAAIGAFETADSVLFAHLSPDAVRLASRAYVDALWAKDAVEDKYSTPPPDHHVAWNETHDALVRRADIAGIEDRYADDTVDAWARHKRGEDYCTPLLAAQTYEVRAALQDPEYPRKRRHGQQGPGPLPALYLFGVELHDVISMHDEPDPKAVEWGVTVLEQYFARIREVRDE